MTQQLPSLDGRRFAMTSSTTSEFSAQPTTYTYREDTGLVWGDYDGDTVDHGHFVGHRTGDEVVIDFVHKYLDGSVGTGRSATTLQLVDGVLELEERYELNGVAGVSRAREVH